MARTGGSVRHEQRVRNKISREDGEIRLQRKRETHATLYLGLAHIRAKMQIAEDGDTKSVKGFGQISQGDGDAFGNQRVRLKQ